MNRNSSSVLLCRMKIPVGVIGAGMGGLATAIRLSHLGYEVHLFDKNPGVGGKLSSFEDNGFRFDFGPSLFTLPEYVKELLQLSENPVPFEYERLETVCNYFYEDGTFLKAYSDLDLFEQELEQKLQVPKGVLASYLNHSARIYRHTAAFFLEKPIHKLRTFLNHKILISLLNAPTFDIFKSMHRANNRRLKHPKLVQLFDRYATYNGSNPYQAPGILNVIPSLEYLKGAWFPKGGMHSITLALENTALQNSVQFHLEEAVERIDIEQGEVRGLTTQKGHYRFPIVVSNSDVWYVYKNLLHQDPSTIPALRQERSSSALVFYWGIRGIFDQLDVHNIFFASDYKAEFEHLFKTKKPYSDPTVYINITSKKCPTDAPEGHENWFVMINVPSSGEDLNQHAIDTYRAFVQNKLNRLLNIDLKNLIVSEKITSPGRIDSQTMSYMGSLYGTASNTRMSAFLRHPNTTGYKGLYFCGGSVHPGGGIPLCLLSGKIVSEMIHEKYGRH